MSILLAIETSQRIGGVALRDAAGHVSVEMLSPRKRHDDDLLPAIDRLFRRAGLSPGDLAGGAVGVSIGPGGFTGLRIAVATAKAFAQTLDVALLAVPSALVAAQSLVLQTAESSGQSLASGAGAADQIASTQSTIQTGELLVALAAKGLTCWCTRVRIAQHIAGIVEPAGLGDAGTMNLQGVDLVLADEHLPEPMRQRCEQVGVEVIDPSFDPRACLVVAQRMLDAGMTSDPLTLSPLYPRPPEAVSLWEKRSQ